MKAKLLRTTIALHALLCAATPLHAEQTSPNIRLKIDFYQINLTTFSNLLEKQKPLQDSLEKRIIRLHRQGKVTLLNTTLLTTRDGEKCHTSSGQEFIFPTEYAPPGFNPPQTLSGGSPTTLFVARPSGATPTAFEIYSLGEELTLTPTSGEQSVDVLLTATQSSFHLLTIWQEHRDQWGNGSISMPETLAHRVDHHITLRYHQPRLISTLTPFTAKGNPHPKHKILVFITATRAR